jgi:uncharacterized protein (TIGR03435 family)
LSQRPRVPTSTDDDLWLLLQPLLAERFKLKFHRETKQLPVYSLVVAKGGPKLKAHNGTGEPSMSGCMGSGKASLNGTGTSMAKLADIGKGSAGDYRYRWS